MKINTPKIGKILEVEINLSVLKLIYLGEFVSDLKKFFIEINRKCDQLTKAFCSAVNQTFLMLFWDTRYTINIGLLNKKIPRTTSRKLVFIAGENV